MNMTSARQIYLASSSPRRAELLSQIGVKFEVLRVSVDERQKKQESVEDYVARLALEKAIEGLKCTDNKMTPVLGADTVVFVGTEILGKPTCFEDAQRMWHLLSGKTHEVLTSVAVVNKNRQQHIIQRSYVTMREVTDVEIEAYWRTGEPKDKAGSYAVQGKAAVFISHINGSYSGVMGLPIFETAKLLRAHLEINL